MKKPQRTFAAIVIGGPWAGRWYEAATTTLDVVLGPGYVTTPSPLDQEQRQIDPERCSVLLRRAFRMPDVDTIWNVARAVDRRDRAELPAGDRDWIGDATMTPEQIRAIEEGVSARMGKPARVIAVEVRVVLDTELPAPHSKLSATFAASPIMLADSPAYAVATGIDEICLSMERRLSQEGLAKP